MRVLFIALVLFVAGCATAPPIDMANTDPSMTPDRAVADPDMARGQRVAWGGTVVNTRNLKEVTEIEVLGYSLAKNGRPEITGNPQRRFLLVHPGYLEPADYRSGRVVSVTGVVGSNRQGTVGEAPYVYPVLQAEQIYVWPINEEVRRNPNVNFGIGVGVIFGR